MAGESMVMVEIQNLTRVEKDVYYLRTSAGNMRVYGERMVANITRTSTKIFKESIDRNVYAFPESTYTRSRRLRGGVKSQGFAQGLAAGSIFIDKGVTGNNGYFYPLSVEQGITSKPNYIARHYWAKGKALAIIEFRKNMKPFANEMAAKLLNK